MKETARWHSARLGREVQFVRWGHFGRPVLVFPTAGGDAEEIERFLMIKVLDPLISAGRIKVYSCDSVAGAAWLSGDHSPRHCAALQNAFDAYVYREVVPAIRADCRSNDIEITVAGASIGAFNALASICRHPDVFDHAYCLSGTYDLSRWMKGEWCTDFFVSSPLHWLPGHPDDNGLLDLRRRHIVLATGEGRWEDPAQSWAAAKVLGDKGVPNRVDPWGPEHDHDWMTWRKMMPHYLGELTA